MGLLLDVVPNHMCIASPDNRWWNDVLENGRSSPFAPYFDVDWHPPKPELAEKVLLPVLGGQYGRVLESQELTIEYEAGAFHARYYDHRFPIGPAHDPAAAPRRWSRTCAAATPTTTPTCWRFESIVTATRHLPTRLDTDPEQVRERQREKEIVKRRLDALVTGSAAARDALERSLRAINGSGANRAASTGSRRCWPIRPTASATGAWPRRRSTTVASSTSTTWPRSGSRRPGA